MRSPRPGDFLDAPEPGLGEVPADIRMPSGPPPPPPADRPFRALQPPRVVPPYGAAFFFASDDATVGPAPAVQVFSGAAAKVTIPGNSTGVVRELNLFVNGLLATSQIAFAVLVNGNPAQGYDNIRMPQITLAAYGYSPNDFYIVLPMGASVQVRATVGDAVAYALSFSLRGWSWSVDQSAPTVDI